MAVSNEVWARGMLELALLPSREEDRGMESLRGEIFKRELQAYLTDHEWRHGVSECLRGQGFFPTIYEMSNHCKGAPLAPVQPNSGLLSGGFGCDLCEGSGFEPFQRGRYAFVRHCPRGCKPYRHSDGPRGDSRAEEWSAASYGQDFGKVSQRGAQRSTEAIQQFAGVESRLKAICREKTKAGLDGFRYPGIDQDIAEEAKPVDPAVEWRGNAV